jgi:3-hydroxyacyl-[acyl-carrier-protein] dehydratase
MRFCLLDRIVRCDPGRQLCGLKRLTSAEEYLADHFPGFPIMPGVLQLQTLVEAGSWLLRETDEFRHSVIVLREIKNVRFGNLMQPGKSLDVTVDLLDRDVHRSTLKGRGECEGVQTVAAQFVLATYNLRDRDPSNAEIDDRMIRHWRERRRLLAGQIRG